MMNLKNIIATLIVIAASVITVQILSPIMNSRPPIETDGIKRKVKKLLSPSIDAPELEWELLYEFDYTTGKGPQKLMDLDGKMVKLPGYIVPLTDSYSELQEFIVVPDSQSCIHVPPPPPNLIVAVRMNQVLSLDEIYNPAWITGIFTIEKSESIYGGSAYKIEGVQLEEFEFEGYY